VKTIVVPLDGSEFSEVALRAARAIAREHHATLQLVRVTVPSVVEAADLYLQEVAGEIDDVPVSTVVVVGEPGEPVAHGIDQAVKDAPDTIVCMSAHGRSGIGAALVGSTTEDYLHRTDRPVLVVGRHCSTSWPDQRRMLVPLDGSGRAERILPKVAEVVGEWDLEPWLLQVAHPFDTEVAHDLDHALDRARARLADLGITAKIDFQFASNATVTIDSQARHLGAALIVMSSYVHPGLARTLLGSVTMGVIHDAPCPVLVCPPELGSGDGERHVAT
jgi:nucleotide-binding universal stress UspA family protein